MAAGNPTFPPALQVDCEYLTNHVNTIPASLHRTTYRLRKLWQALGRTSGYNLPWSQPGVISENCTDL